jgi:peroxiredoxin
MKQAMALQKIGLVLALTGLFACNTQKNPNMGTGQAEAFPGQAELQGQSVQISGTVLNPQEGDITIFRIVNDERKMVSTLKADSNGAFSTLVQSDYPDFYLINFYDNQEKLIVIDKDPITIKADGASQDGIFQVTGSNDLKLLEEFQALEQQLSEKSNVLRQKYFSAQDKEPVRLEYEAFVLEAEASFKAFLQKSDRSLVGILPILQMDPDRNIALMSEMVNKLAETHPYNDMVKGQQEKLEVMKKTAIGQPAPEIKLLSPEGKEISLSSLKGKYVLIDFWASWCGPCRQENPNVVKMYDQFKGKDFEIFGVSLDRDRDAWLKAIDTDKLTWVHVSDLKFWQSEVVSAYNIEGIPMTYLVDKNGIIVAKNLRGKMLEEKLKEVL